jgi:hypothetical protein
MEAEDMHLLFIISSSVHGMYSTCGVLGGRHFQMPCMASKGFGRLTLATATKDGRNGRRGSRDEVFSLPFLKLVILKFRLLRQNVKPIFC